MNNLAQLPMTFDMANRYGSSRCAFADEMGEQSVVAGAAKSIIVATNNESL